MLDYITQRGSAPTSKWAFIGANRANTHDGRAWARLTQDGGDFTVSVFRDELRQHAVAAGARSGAGEVALAALNDSGLSGTVEIAAGTGECELDIFYACDDDLTARHTGIAAFLIGGEFAGEPGFRGPCARAKRAIDAMLASRLGADIRAESLAPLAEAASSLALSYIYEWLSTRPQDPARVLATFFAARAASQLTAVRLRRGAELVTPFAARVVR